MTEKPKTVVDYEAWERGYMPPSEHVLIDQLSYRGAKVLMMMDHGERGALWLVVREPLLDMDLVKEAIDLSVGILTREKKPAASSEDGTADNHPENGSSAPRE
jgi:hypothetical protein